MAYAAALSLKQTIGRLLHPSQSGILPLNLELESIFQEARDLQSFLLSVNSLRSRNRVDDLERQIKDAVHKAEDLIESHITDGFLSDLLKVKQEISSLTKKLKNKGEYNSEEDQQLCNSSVSSGIDSLWSDKMVGLENERNQLKRSLLSGPAERQIISIVGMAGIGKTTLADKVYCDPFVQSTFPYRCFMRVGPEYQLQETLLRIGTCFHIDKMSSLYQFLFSRKFLIVLDDIWDTQVWEQLREYIPDRRNGSRIILTTRLVDVARNATLHGSLVKMPLLNDDESWELLHDSIFAAEESCNHQLEAMGKQIAKICEGLPLAILAVGWLLKGVDKTVKEWMSVTKDEISLITPILNALSLSYEELPQYLKACFLYMGVFPKNYEIPISKLIQLWVAEGFLEAESGKSLNEIADKFLDDLVSRNLVLLGEQSSTGKIKTCRLHFVFRNLCVREAQKEKFFQVINKLLNSFPEGTTTQRRLCVHNNSMLGLREVYSSMRSVSAARSLLCFGPQHHNGLLVYLNYRLLKVLDALKIRFYKFPDDVLKLVQLRYLAITHDGELPETISRLFNLQVLIVRRRQRIKWSEDPVYLPIEIWNLHELRHLECVGFDLPDPSPAANDKRDGCNDSLFLEKLLTLSGVSAHSCTLGILARMPNLMKLGIWIDSRPDGVETFSFFDDYTDLYLLESFKWVFVHPFPESKVAFPSLTSCYNLRKITLSGCGFSWEYIMYIGRLPNLEVLKLRCYAFRGPEWVTTEGEFRKLKFLLLEDLDKEQWDVESDKHFPLLRRLIIRHCYKLIDIPFELVYIPTLEIIEVDECSPSLVDSAKNLREVVGNDPVLIHSSWDDKTRKS